MHHQDDDDATFSVQLPGDQTSKLKISAVFYQPNKNDSKKH